MGPRRPIDSQVTYRKVSIIYSISSSAFDGLVGDRLLGPKCFPTFNAVIIFLDNVYHLSPQKVIQISCDCNTNYSWLINYFVKWNAPKML